jgi:hypothetical protein
VVINIFNPEWDFAKWSEFENLKSIELLYRRVGDSEWRNGLDEDSARISFETLVPEGTLDYGFSSAKWNPVGLNDGEYELMLHVICESSGLSFPPPGIDDYFSSPIRGVC